MSLDRREFVGGVVAGLGIGVGGCSQQAAGEGGKIKGDTVDFRRKVEIRHDVDVFVAGGGPSGVAASVACARQGAKVFLAERTNCLGGMGTAGRLPVFMRFSDGENFLAGGMGREILTKMNEAGGSGPDDERTIKTEVLKRVYDDMLVDAEVDFTFDTRVIGVEKQGGRVGVVVLAAKSGLSAVRAKMFIDCTGDGDLAAWAGAPCEKGDEDGNLMAGTLCSTWADIDWDKAREFGMDKQEKLLPKAIEAGVFTNHDKHLPGMWRTGENIAGGNIGHTFGVDGTDERSLTEAILWGRKSLVEYERYYKQYLRGFENMELVATGSLLGVRETRRIMGDYVLNLDDFKKRAVFEDEIGRFAYPVDIHAGKPGEKAYQAYAQDFKNLRYGSGENYGIPYRVLIPRKLSNVLVAGRCISTDRYMQSSIRVMPGCFITGQAAGVAAAMAVEKHTNTRGVNVRKLQKRLIKMGGFLPNFKA